MHWFDFILLGTALLGVYSVAKMGLIKAVLMSVGMYVGWLLAGQWADDIGALFEESLSDERQVTIISYAIIIVVATIVSSFVVKSSSGYFSR